MSASTPTAPIEREANTATTGTVIQYVAMSRVDVEHWGAFPAGTEIEVRPHVCATCQANTKQLGSLEELRLTTTSDTGKFSTVKAHIGDRAFVAVLNVALWANSNINVEIEPAEPGTLSLPLTDGSVRTRVHGRPEPIDPADSIPVSERGVTIQVSKPGTVSSENGRLTLYRVPLALRFEPTDGQDSKTLEE